MQTENQRVIPKWDEYFMNIARTVSTRSNCIRKQVGAVIVDNNKHIIATGYNGTPSKVESCFERGSCYRMDNNIPSGTMYETCRSIHAEENALLQAGEDKCNKATMYIYGHNFVCISCARRIVQNKIAEVILQESENSSMEFMLVTDLAKSL